jgi:hypothetical protein
MLISSAAPAPVAHPKIIKIEIQTHHERFGFMPFPPLLFLSSRSTFPDPSTHVRSISHRPVVRLTSFSNPAMNLRITIMESRFPNMKTATG